MAACYGCGEGTFTFAGSYCTECRPPREDQTQPTNARGSGPYNAYMPTAANERDAIVAYIYKYALDFDGGDFEKLAGLIQRGEHTK